MAAGLLAVPERALARVNVGAVERNCARLMGELEHSSRLCAVVKADGYGHGALACARAAGAAGASWLAVATAAEAAALRRADVRERVLVMGALSRPELQQALACDADVVAWDERFVAAVAALGGGRVHVKLDTGMGRLGTRDVAQATRVVEAVRAAPQLSLIGAMTHFATADELGDRFFGEQRERFAAWAVPLKEDHPDLMLHAANSAATLRDSGAHFDMVRCGIAIYGMDPFGADPFAWALEPALELCSYVAAVKPCRAGQSTGYGRRFVAQHDTTLATLPIGYGDGVRRGLTNNADILIGGRRHRLVGAVSMDNITVELSDHDPPVQEGQAAVLIGRDEDERILAEDLARRLDTVNYEVTCALSARMPRRYHRDGTDVEQASGPGAPAT